MAIERVEKKSGSTANNVKEETSYKLNISEQTLTFSQARELLSKMNTQLLDLNLNKAWLLTLYSDYEESAVQIYFAPDKEASMKQMEQDKLYPKVYNNCGVGDERFYTYDLTRYTEADDWYKLSDELLVQKKLDEGIIVPLDNGFYLEDDRLLNYYSLAKLKEMANAGELYWRESGMTFDLALRENDPDGWDWTDEIPY